MLPIDITKLKSPKAIFGVPVATGRPLNLTPVVKTYENQTVELAGKILVTMRYEDQQVRHLPLIVTRGKDKAALFGLQWLERIKLNWHDVCCTRAYVAGILQKHTSLQGTQKRFAAKIHVNDGTTQIFQGKANSLQHDRLDI